MRGIWLGDVSEVASGDDGGRKERRRREGETWRRGDLETGIGGEEVIDGGERCSGAA